MSLIFGHKKFSDVPGLTRVVGLKVRIETK